MSEKPKARGVIKSHHTNTDMEKKLNGAQIGWGRKSPWTERKLSSKTWSTPLYLLPWLRKGEGQGAWPRACKKIYAKDLPAKPPSIPVLYPKKTISCLAYKLLLLGTGLQQRQQSLVSCHWPCAMWPCAASKRHCKVGLPVDPNSCSLLTLSSPLWNLKIRVASWFSKNSPWISFLCPWQFSFPAAREIKR